MPEYILLKRIACTGDGCGASWMPSMLPSACPYCGAAEFAETDPIRIISNEAAIRAAKAIAEQYGFKVYECDTPLVEQIPGAGQARYAKEIRGIVSAFWRGAIDIDQAFAIFQDTVRLGLTGAWHNASLSVGIQPSELSPEERMALMQAIARETTFIFPFLLDIEAGSRANKGKLGPLLNRAEMWALRWADIYSLALTMARNDPKLTWEINVVRIPKKNCNSCLRLNGKTKRASYWTLKGIHPQHPPNDKLICGGYL